MLGTAIWKARFSFLFALIACAALAFAVMPQTAQALGPVENATISAFSSVEGDSPNWDKYIVYGDGFGVYRDENGSCCYVYENDTEPTSYDDLIAHGTCYGEKDPEGNQLTYKADKYYTFLATLSPYATPGYDESTKVTINKETGNLQDLGDHIAIWRTVPVRKLVREIEIQSTSDWLPSYGERAHFSDINETLPIVKGSGLRISDTMWRWKKWVSDSNSTNLERSEENCIFFEEGRYSLSLQIRIDDEDAISWAIAKDVSVVVDGVPWAVRSVTNKEGYSYVYVDSPVYEVVKSESSIEPLSAPRYAVHPDGLLFVGKPATPFSLAELVTGGSKAYVFSRVSGPNWASVSPDGMVTGIPQSAESDVSLIVRVTSGEAFAMMHVTMPDVYDYDKRTEVTHVEFATDVDFIPSFGATPDEAVLEGKLTQTAGAPAVFMSGKWNWYYMYENGSLRKVSTSDSFGEGAYRLYGTLDISGENNAYYRLGSDISVTVNGVDWERINNVKLDDTYSRVTFASPEFTIGHVPASSDVVSHAGIGTDGTAVETCANCGDTITSTVPAVEKISLAQDSLQYDGKAKKPAVAVVDRTGKALVEGEDYAVSYASNTEVGTARATVTLMGRYKGSKALSFQIVKPTSTKPAVKPTDTKPTVKQAVKPAKQAVKLAKSKVTLKRGKSASVKVKGAKVKLAWAFFGSKKTVKKAKKALKVKVSGKGKVTVKALKGVKKGTYKVKVWAKASSKYKKSNVRTITVKVK